MFDDEYFRKQHETLLKMGQRFGFTKRTLLDRLTIAEFKGAEFVNALTQSSRHLDELPFARASNVLAEFGRSFDGLAKQVALTSPLTDAQTHLLTTSTNTQAARFAFGSVDFSRLGTLISDAVEVQ